MEALCVLCDMDPVDVGHIVARKSGDERLVNWIRGVAPALSNFREDDAVNLICLCPTHQRQYDLGHFVLVPSKQQRELLLEHEHRDFAVREEILAQGGVDPGQTLPPLIDEFEYIPLQGGPFRIHIHNPTPYDPFIFVFDNIDHRPCPLLHFRASHIALMVEADPHLLSLARMRFPKGDVAESQITTLLRLYQRQPGLLSNLQLSISARILTTVPGSPPPTNTAPAHSISPAPMPDLTPCSLASIDDLSQTDDAEYAGADIQLAEYAKERSVTWEDLKNWPPLFAGEEVGRWRFASADDICRSRQL